MMNNENVVETSNATGWDWTNAEGYKDPTAVKAMEKYERNPDKGLQAIRLMIRIADLAGFDVQGRIWLRDRKTGKEYR